MSNKARLKQIAEAILKHIQTNAVAYITLIGHLAQKDYPAALACLKVLIFRVAIGGVYKWLDRRKKNDEDTKN